MRISQIVLAVIALNGIPLIAQAGKNSGSDSAEHAKKDAAPPSSGLPVSEDPTAGGLQLNSDNLFLVTRVSVSTDAGIRSSPAGSKVRVLRQDAAGIRVVDPSGNQFVVSAKQLTNDNAVAKELAAKQDAARAGIGNAYVAPAPATVAPPLSAADASREKVANAANARVDERAAILSAPPRPFTPTSALDRPAKDSGTRVHVHGKKDPKAKR